MDGDGGRDMDDDERRRIDDDERRWIDETMERLSHSAFRARFALADKDRAYARAKGRATIERHAHEMLRERVGAAEPRNDGRQTPWRGHPVFTAQHATATCCRGCIEKWHRIPKGRALTDAEIDRLADLVMAWIDRDLTGHPAASGPGGTNGGGRGGGGRNGDGILQTQGGDDRCGHAPGGDARRKRPYGELTLF